MLVVFSGENFSGCSNDFPLNISNPETSFYVSMRACVISDSEVRLLVSRKDDSGWSFSSAVVRGDHGATAASSIKQIPREQGETTDNN